MPILALAALIGVAAFLFTRHPATPSTSPGAVTLVPGKRYRFAVALTLGFDQSQMQDQARQALIAMMAANGVTVTTAAMGARSGSAFGWSVEGAYVAQVPAPAVSTPALQYLSIQQIG